MWLTYRGFLQLTPRTVPIIWQFFWIPMQFHHFRVCLCHGKLWKLVCPHCWCRWIIFLCHGEFLILFLLLYPFLQGRHRSVSRQLGHTAEMPPGQPNDVLHRDLEAVLPKSCSSSGPGSSGVFLHGLYTQSCSSAEMLLMWLDFATCNTTLFLPLQAPSVSGPSMPHVLNAIGELKINNFSSVQLKDVEFVDKWFQKKLRPFLASSSMNFLACLSSKNFSCQTYQIV